MHSIGPVAYSSSGVFSYVFLLVPFGYFRPMTRFVSFTPSDATITTVVGTHLLHYLYIIS